MFKNYLLKGQKRMCEKLVHFAGAEDGKSTMWLYVKITNHEFINYLFGHCSFSGIITETTDWF